MIWLEAYLFYVALLGFSFYSLLLFLIVVRSLSSGHMRWEIDKIIDIMWMVHTMLKRGIMSALGPRP